MNKTRKKVYKNGEIPANITIHKHRCLVCDKEYDCEMSYCNAAYHFGFCQFRHFMDYQLAHHFLSKWYYNKNVSSDE